MISKRAIGATAAALLAVGTLGLLLVAGCSGKGSQPEPRMVKVEPKKPAAQAPAPKAAKAPAKAVGQGANPGRQMGESILHGPGDYLETATVKAPRFAKKTAFTAYIENEIKQYQALEGRYPKSLDELGKWAGEPVQAPPSGMKYNYDPKTGKLEIVPAD